jgi:hypothetical protein
MDNLQLERELRCSGCSMVYVVSLIDVETIDKSCLTCHNRRLPPDQEINQAHTCVVPSSQVPS